MSNKVPDFDDMMSLADEIGELQRRAMLLDIEIKEMISIVTQKATTEEKWLVNGKTPSMDFIKSCFHTTGMPDVNIKAKRVELATVEAELESCKLKFQVYRDMVTMYVTDSANKRASVS